MAIVMDQVAEASRWTDTRSRADTFPAERLFPIPNNCSRARRRALLSRIVEADILPQLARSRHVTPVCKATPNQARTTTTDDDTAELVRLLLTQETEAAVDFITRLGQRGITPAALYLGIMTQAAHRLGELWDDDRCDMIQLTISMGRLQLLVRALSPDFQQTAIRQPQAETVLLLPAPGDRHMFGLMVLAEFFIREAWYVRGGPGFAIDEAIGIARSTWIDVVGFSIGSRGQVEALATCIQALRRAARNPHLHVMVGGPLFVAQPALVTRVGADVAATDAQAAVWQARRLMNPQRLTD